MLSMPNSQDFAPNHNSPDDNKFADAIARLCVARGVPINTSRNIDFHLRALVLALNPAGVKHDSSRHDLLAYLLLHFGLGVEV